MSAPRLEAAGPVSQAYVDTDAPIACIMGPEGSAKTTAGILRGVTQAYLWPRTAPGITRYKFGIVRRLLKDLEKTTMESWVRWFPRSSGTWRGGKGEPATHEIILPHPSGGRVEFQTQFIALGDLRVEEAMRGWEGSGLFVDEVDLAPNNVLSWTYGRMGRFPPETLARNPKHVWAACNAPEAGSWIIDDFIDEPKPGHQLFRQPSGLSPEAENIALLGRDWYHKLALTLPPFERRRRIENIPGLSRGAQAVYPEFNPDLHVAADTLRVADRPVIVGLDAGGTPAAALFQHMPDGQFRGIGEISTHAREHNSVTGPTRFGEALAQLLAERCRGLPVRALADPSAAYGADTANGEANWMEIVGRVAGIHVMPAPTNDVTPRQEALRLPMTRMIDGRAPGLLLCPTHCRLLARALARDYQWTVVAGRRGTRVLDNWASHIVDAGQYALLDGGHYHQVMARQTRQRVGAAPVIAPHSFNIFARSQNHARR